MAKTKLNQEVINIAIKYITLGTPVKYICDSLMISEVSWYAWYNKGEELDDERTLETKFFKSVKKAKGDMVARKLQMIDKAAAEGTWTAAAWVLERMDFENFGRKEKLEHSGELNTTINFIPAKE